MKTIKKTFPLTTVCKMQKKINTSPKYQRLPVWTKKQKQLLMDTILRNYDIPKFYWREVKQDDGVEYEVVDGQQRLLAIWEFANGEYPLASNTKLINGLDISDCVYSNLPTEIDEVFSLYGLDVAIIMEAQEDKDEAEIRDMFIRLQGGTPLKPQEKRNAMSGDMRDFVTEIAEHSFFNSCKFSNERFAFQHMAAQTILLELKDLATNIKDKDLNEMYEAHSTFDKNGKTARKVKKIYDFLLKAFPERNPHLERYNVVNLYCMASVLIDKYVWQDLDKPLADWLVRFEMERREDNKKDDDKRDVLLLKYHSLISSSGDTKEKICDRLEMLKERFFLACPNIEKIDPIRGFSDEQRLAIHWRDGGRCQLKIKCTGGEKLSWDKNKWHADHKIPHSKGGTTTVSNGQVACPECNLSKGGNG